jgi:hypothetical protein
MSDNALSIRIIIAGSRAHEGIVKFLVIIIL